MEVKRFNSGPNRGPIIITICGSMRFTREMLDVHRDLCSQGYFVFLPNIDAHKVPTGSSPANDEEQTLHDAKISFGDAIYIVNKDDYIGESTFHEFQLARKLGKHIIWYNHNGDDIYDATDETRKRLAELDKSTRNLQTM